jgi:hypothetical protein
MIPPAAAPVDGGRIGRCPARGGKSKTPPRPQWLCATGRTRITSRTTGRCRRLSTRCRPGSGPGPPTKSSTTSPRHSAGQLWRDHDRLLWVEIQTAAVEPSGWRLIVPLVDADQGRLSPAAGGPDRPLTSPRPPHHGRPRQRPRRTRRPPQRYPARGPARRARSVYRPSLLATPDVIVAAAADHARTSRRCRPAPAAPRSSSRRRRAH